MGHGLPITPRPARAVEANEAAEEVLLVLDGPILTHGLEAHLDALVALQVRLAADGVVEPKAVVAVLLRVIGHRGRTELGQRRPGSGAGQQG